MGLPRRVEKIFLIFSKKVVDKSENWEYIKQAVLNSGYLSARFSEKNLKKVLTESAGYVILKVR